jgi:hypothetical protein
MRQVGTKARGRFDAFRNGTGERARKRGRVTATATHEVGVGVIGKVVHGGPVTEVDVNQHPHLFEVLQRAVDRTDRHVRVNFLHPDSEILGGGVITGGHQGIKDRSARCRNPAARLTEHLNDRGGPGVSVRPVLLAFGCPSRDIRLASRLAGGGWTPGICSHAQASSALGRGVLPGTGERAASVLWWSSSPAARRRPRDPVAANTTTNTTNPTNTMVAPGDTSRW